MIGLITEIYRRENFPVSIGGHMHPCKKCGQLQPHKLIQVIRKDAGMLKVHKDTPLYKISRCEVCDHQSRHHKKSNPPCLEYWNPDTDYHDYAMRSGYDTSGQDHEIITPISAQALLKAVTKARATNVPLTWKDYAQAVFVFMLTGLVGMMLFAQQADTNSDEAGIILLGIPAAGIVFALFFLIYAQKRKQLHGNHLIEFKNRIIKLGITPGAVVNALPESALKDKNIYTLIRPFM